jgi:uncharacterized membrane protein YkvA (DUF1232 family)
MLADEQQAKQPSVQRLTSSIRRVFIQFKIMRRAVVHPEVPWHAKVIAACALLYVVSPIQIIPNFIPIIGQMDDLLVITLGVRYLRRSVPQRVLDECENHVKTPRKPEVLLGAATDPFPDSK